MKRQYSKIFLCSLLLVGFFCWCVELSAAGQCTAPPSTPLKLTILSQRNDTGHWTATIKLNHESSYNYAGPFELDVEHSTVNCIDSEAVYIETTVRAPPTQPQPGDGYEQLLPPGLGLYKFHKALDTWYNAEMICVKEGGHLLVLSSDKEFAVLKKKWDESGVGGTYLHIGINDFDKEGTFVTVTGDPINKTGYVKWLPGEPNSGNTANCGAVTREGNYVDSGCSNRFSFFCKK
ncbi:hemolymph lipopolysaccharide-binding protein-like [Periplaneta americana]|uniref:hemolymph lipopolysaccharide-binding protein-like n=1 Tax=Periplaneta americana TaxID=6978 RepID=UPI0037E7DDD5